MNEPKRIPITDSKTGQVRYSEPLHQQGPRKQVLAPDTHLRTSVVSASTSEVVAEKAEESAMDTATVSVDSSDEQDVTSKSKPKPKPKPKVEVETLGQFITYAYGKKGQKLALSSKVERIIAQNPKLTVDEMDRVSSLIKEDVVLAVPRQLLLVARTVQGYPALRGALNDFVRNVMLGHPLFMQRGIAAAVQNLDAAPNPAEALKLLATTEKQLLPADVVESMKDAEFEQLRVNAVNCMAVWLAHVKGLSIATTADMLFVALWRPQASVLEHDTSKLRALTQIDELGAIGVACDEYRRQAQDKHAQADAAAREASGLRERVSSVEDELSRARDVIERQEATMSAMEAARIDALAAITSSAETEAAHIRDDLEQMRTRVLRRLKADVDLLELGLEALRRSEPKVHVMMDSAERVTDALRKEVKNLQGSN